MLVNGPTRASAVCRAGVLPFSPVYQETVLALVPFCSAVAVANGGAATRCGGVDSKKLLAAAKAEAGRSVVCASVPTAVVSAAWRLVAVAAAVAPIVNWFGPGVADVVACSESVVLVPSGRFRLN